jgi:hypothetical protein
MFLFMVYHESQIAVSVDRTQCLQISCSEVIFSLALSQVS